MESAKPNKRVHGIVFLLLPVTCALPVNHCALRYGCYSKLPFANLLDSHHANVWNQSRNLAKGLAAYLAFRHLGRTVSSRTD